MSDSKVIEPQLSKRATQFAQWCHGRIDTRGLAKCVVGQVELPALEPRPRDAGPDEPCLEAVALEGAALEDAIVGVDALDQPVLNRSPVLPQLPSMAVSIGTPAYSIRAAAAM